MLATSVRNQDSDGGEESGPPPKRKEALERLMNDHKAVRLPYVVDGKVVRQQSRSQKSGLKLGGTLGRMSVNMRKRFGGGLGSGRPSSIAERE
jgi:hypothetical protein